jgi:hypothetical protein
MLSDQAAQLLRELQGVSWIPTYNVCGGSPLPARRQAALQAGRREKTCVNPLCASRCFTAHDCAGIARARRGEANH